MHFFRKILYSLTLAVLLMTTALMAPSGAVVLSDGEVDADMVTDPVDPGPQADLSTVDLPRESAESSVTAGGLLAPATTVATLTCSVSLDHPHYSAKTPGVIAKLRYSCSGAGSASLRASLYLYKWAPGSAMGAPKKMNLNVIRSVTPGSTGTIYVPKVGESGAGCNPNHWYNAFADVTQANLASGDTDSASLSTGSLKVVNCP